MRRCAQQWQPELIESAKALPWQDRESPGPKPGKKKKERDHAAMLEEVMKQCAGDEEAQTIAIFARQRAADALHVSQGQAADGAEDNSSTGAPEEKRDEAEDSGAVASISAVPGSFGCCGATSRRFGCGGISCSTTSSTAFQEVGT